MSKTDQISQMNIDGCAHIFGDHIDTDIIIPTQFCTTTDKTELAKHCMNDVRENFYDSVQDGDVIIAGDNFGCGSSREAAPIAILGCGIQCVIAKSFSRLFYRNAVNLGLLVIEDKELYKRANEGDRIAVDLDTNRIFVNGVHVSCIQDDECGIVAEIVKEKGLMNYLLHNNMI
ncbi:LeuD/DmdB family oxidoreductase small subunit [Anaeromicropila populeti]|uniref:2-oxosuberate synthase, isomerase small subunit n=1 Tax=Anaeromicropila populeti TaxID=37658 RepID=A0A1I6HSL7_9FIRM|nr:3-isopropylmalate dehydratase small subunit [Anaeromicropila populeti]SFR57423.1 2-oxosuberate synthase, isomerase small subunit [Anaeromicropila populeti]